MLGMDEWNIVLVGDRTLPRRGLRTILEGGHGLSVVGEADDVSMLPSLLGKLEPHLVILDGSVADLKSETVSAIKAKHPRAKVLILTTLDERECLYRSLRCGADGYFLKEDTAEELISAIEKVLQNQAYISPRLSSALVEILRDNRKGAENPLSIREKEVLRLLAEGKSSKEIAGVLSISIYTVERHRANVMRKLKVKKNTELVKYAINHDLV
jgi:two-component system, NarL family, response regulator NreC